MNEAILDEAIEILTDLSVEPTVTDIKFILSRDGRGSDGVSIYFSEDGEYYPVKGVGIVTEDDVLSKGQIVLIV